jgi:hypothetical protein
MYEDYEPWENGVPADLVPAMKHLRDRFNYAHFEFGLVTRLLCYSQLHKNASQQEDLSDYAKALVQLKARIGLAASQRFNETFAQGTPSAIFKSFLDFYLEGLSVEALLIYEKLVEIGRANEGRLGFSHLEWAEKQTKHLIRSNTHHIDIWVTEVCDTHPYVPAEEIEDQLETTKWQAPRFLIMRPSRYEAYDAAREWERVDSETSRQWRKMFYEHYVVHLEAKLKKLAGENAVKLAIQLKSPAQVAAVNSLVESDPADDADRHSKLWRQVMNAKLGETVSTRQAATLLGVSTKTVNRRVTEGQLTEGAKRGRITCQSLRRKLPKVQPD